MYGAPNPYNAPPPGYGAPPPPAYYPPPPPQQQAGPTIITIGDNNSGGSGSTCLTCGKDTGQIARKKVGCVTIAWCICLFLWTGWLCCLPFCIDSCKDTELICVKCQQVKQKISANCC